MGPNRRAARCHESRSADRRRVCERGTGTISSIAAVTAFLGFLLFAVQLLFNLYATSVTTANSFDAARTVAAYEAAHDQGDVGAAMARAESSARSRMGAYADRVSFDWSGTDDDVVRLHVHADNPRMLLFASSPLPFTEIDRTIEVRVERLR